MKHTISNKALVFLSVTLSLTAGCAPMTEAELEAREYSRADFRNQFIEDRDRCQAGGGRMYIQGFGGAVDNDGIPLSRVYYVCT